jgi:hypothetical protein
MEQFNFILGRVMLVMGCLGGLVFVIDQMIEGRKKDGATTRLHDDTTTRQRTEGENEGM